MDGQATRREAAEELGIPERTVQRAVKIEKALSPEAMEAAVETGVGITVMEEAAKKKTAAEQVEAIRSYKPPKKSAPPPPPQQEIDDRERWFDIGRRWWAKAPPDWRRDFMDEVSGFISAEQNVTRIPR